MGRRRLAGVHQRTKTLCLLTYCYSCALDHFRLSFACVCYIAKSRLRGRANFFCVAPARRPRRRTNKQSAHTHTHTLLLLRVLSVARRVCRVVALERKPKPLSLQCVSPPRAHDQRRRRVAVGGGAPRLAPGWRRHWLVVCVCVRARCSHFV